jgi:hypothetical protein
LTSTWRPMPSTSTMLRGWCGGTGVAVGVGSARCGGREGARVPDGPGVTPRPAGGDAGPPAGAMRPAGVLDGCGVPAGAAAEPRSPPPPWARARAGVGEGA